MTIKTQKAKGVINGLIDMKNCGQYNQVFSYGNGFFRVMSHGLIKTKEDIYAGHHFPRFARPCPTQPRHGFVDSRVVNNKEELLKLYDEVKEQDPDGEILLGGFRPNVNYNSIYVSSGTMSIGEGNDGATGGKNSISFPVAPEQFRSHFYTISGLNENEDCVYLEAIHSQTKDKWELVQARGGPALETASQDYIPSEVEVKEIVKPHDDLLRWEKETKEFKEGTVVYGPGHTLASHAAIHCVINKIPFITTKKPVVGETLKPIKCSRDKKLNRVQFKKGVRAGLNLCKKSTRNDMLKLLYFSLTVLHNWVYIKSTDNAGWLLGAASTIFVKLCAALALGECRHSKSRNTTLFMKGLYSSNREKVYRKALNRISLPLYDLTKAFEVFHSENWSNGFGGTPWANCSWYSHRLWKHIVKLYNKTSENLTDKETTDVISIINKTTNMAHNNGWWFNKIASVNDLDFVAKKPGIAAFCVADVYFKVYNQVKTIKGVARKFRPVESPRKNPSCKDSNGRLVWLKVFDVHDRQAMLYLSIDNGDNHSKKINLSDEGYKKLKQKYKKLERARDKTLIIPLKANGNFRIPGEKEQNIRKVFAI